jgi:polo-like kinase 1
MEIEVRCYFFQAVNALKYLHLNKIIHRDLKLSNLFLNEKMELKLGDFGLAAKLAYAEEKRHTVCGTPNYIAPEVLENRNGHSYEADLWSVGVILYTLLIGKPPFETPHVKSTYKKIKTGTYSFPENIPVSDNSRNTISKLLQLDPSQRPSLSELVCSPFIKNGDGVPRMLPLSTLACPPSANYIKQFLNNKESHVRKFQP